MKKIFLTAIGFLLLAALTATSPIQANAAIVTVDIDATLNDITDPVSISLGMGTYVATPVSTPYTSWNAWGDGYVRPIGCTTGNCTNGWLNKYMIIVDGQASTVGDLTRFPTPEEAFAAMEPFTFTVNSIPEVLFYIDDDPIKDNVGGISLEISQVPLPGAIWLLGSGLIGLVGVRKKFNKHIATKQ